MRACFYPVAAFALCGVLVSCGATEETSGAGGDDGFAANDASAGPTPGAEPSGDNPLPSDGPTQPAPNTPSPDGDGSELDPPDGGSTTAPDDVDAPLTQGPEVPTEPGAAPTDDILEEGENICERQIEFDSVSLLDPPPFDVVIVADHSDSLSWSKEDLSAGLGELLAEVGGSDARFYLLTPTQYGRESAAISRMNGTDLVPWRDPVTGAAYENAMTTYVETCTDDDGVGIPCPEWEPGLDLEYTALGQFEFRMPEPIAAISKEMTEAELTKQQELIRDAILSLGGGAAFEQPLCTLARYISQAPDALPENVVFLVISDENDTTAPEECRDWIEYQQYRLDERVTDCGDDCDFNRYELTATGYQNAVTFTCTPTDDFGNPQPELAIERTLPFGFPVPTCMSERPCDEQDILSASYYCEPGDLLEDCSSACTTEADMLCEFDLSDTTIDGCSESFEFNSTTYANVADYCTQAYGFEAWSGCAGIGYAVSEGTGQLTQRMSLASLIPGDGNAAFAEYFFQTADQILGRDSYVVQAIVHDPSFTCELGSGQSYGTNLASLATDGAVFPICESYAPALAGVLGFARALLETEYTLELSDRETIEAVVVTDQWGRERELSENDYDFDWESGRLSLDQSALTSSDRSLSVEIELHCEPVAR